MRKKWAWFLAIFLVFAGLYAVFTGMEREESRIDVLSYNDGPVEKEPGESIISEDISEDPSNWGFDEAEDFFVEYRMERERVRSQELDTLNEMIKNAEVGEEARKNAEEQLLEITKKMEEELMVENMIKAQGYNDALLFSSNGTATIMVYADELEEQDFMMIAETASKVLGVPREEIQVIQHR